MLTPGELIGQMEEFATDPLPEGWIGPANLLRKVPEGSDQTRGEHEQAVGTHALQQWLEEVYFEEGKKEKLGLEDIRKVGELVRKLLWFEPRSRATASALLEDNWLGQDNQLKAT